MIVDTTEMPRLMAEADLALCAGGSSCYELAYMQLPMLTVVLAKNQKPVAKSLESSDAPVNLGDLGDLKSEHVVDAVSALIKNIRKRENMSRACCTLVDGEGVDRVLMNLAGSRVRLRTAQMDDARMLWEWAMIPRPRQASFTSEEIPWETHKGWFENLMKDLKHKFWIAIGVDDACGIHPFALDKADATLSISTARSPRQRSRRRDGKGRNAKSHFATTDAKTIHAYVKPENEASKRLFFMTGFFEETSVKMKENLALHYTLKILTHNPQPCLPRSLINGRLICPGHPMYIIAEMSANHGQSKEHREGDHSRNEKAGADAVKIQTYTPDTITLNCDNTYFTDCLKGTLWEGRRLYDLYGDAFTPWEWQGNSKS